MTSLKLSQEVTTIHYPSQMLECQGQALHFERPKIIYIFIIKEEHSLCSSELQFGFKKGLSTTQCTFSMLEIIDYYNFNKSDVGVLLLYASKAFDRVNYCKLFNELLKRNISPVLLRLLL